MEAIMEAKEVKAAAHGRWGGILSALAPQLQPALDRVGHHVSCPVHGGKDGYRVFNDVDDSGGGVCNTCGVHPDGFATLMWVSGMDFKEALKSVAEYLRVGIIAQAVWRENHFSPDPEGREMTKNLARRLTESGTSRSPSLIPMLSRPGCIWPVEVSRSDNRKHFVSTHRSRISRTERRSARFRRCWPWCRVTAATPSPFIEPT
jgi:hypothetical protein